jgi:hypothetical protein
MKMIDKITPLTPTEYHYLVRPYWSDGADMVRTTVQELCLKGVLKLEERLVTIHERDRKRKRLFLRLNENFDPSEKFSLPEQAIINVFATKGEQSFSQFRNYVERHWSRNNDPFKEYVYSEMANKGYLILPAFKSGKGRKELRFLKGKIRQINTIVDYMLNNGTLATELKSIGLNIVLLDREVLKKIKAFDSGLLQLGLISYLRNTNEFNSLNSFMMMSNFDTINSFDLSDSSFDFGGGDAGGGGGGDSW